MTKDEDYKAQAQAVHDEAHKDVRHNLRELRNLLEQALECLEEIVDGVQVNTIADALLKRGGDDE